MTALERRYTFWYSLSGNSKKASDYEDAIKPIGTFGTVEEFWQYYSHLKKPDDVPTHTDYHVFRDGIKPMWEDEANQRGARWILRIKNGAGRWEELLLAMIGEQFDVTNKICGVAVSVRGNEDIFSVWVRSGQDMSVKHSVRESLKRFGTCTTKPSWSTRNTRRLRGTTREHDLNTLPNQLNRATGLIVLACLEIS